MARLLLKCLLPLFTLCFILSAGWIYLSLSKPLAHNQQDNYINIPKGTSTQQLAEILKRSGIIRNDLAFLFYIKIRQLGPSLKAGQYRFNSPITPFQVITKLQEGQQRTFKITIIEGWSRWEIASALAKTPELGISQSDAFALLNNPSRIKDIDPSAQDLEGYLFPDTYLFPVNTKPQEILDVIVGKSRSLFTAELVQNLQARQLTPRKVLTIASLIETEAKLPDERPLVSSVIYNRLQKDIPLGIDSAIIYAAKLAGKWKNDGKVYQSDLQRVSPYNTRINRGLPPGPVASPSLSSIQAALQPATTNYLYYVRNPARNDGAHNFYDNASDFQKGVHALREWEKLNR
jgi:UPF0755 protein